MRTLAMERFGLLVCICLAGEFNLVFSLLQEDTPTLGSKNAPRFLTKNSVKTAFDYKENQTVFFYKQDSEELYVGGVDFVLKLNTRDYHLIEFAHMCGMMLKLPHGNSLVKEDVTKQLGTQKTLNYVVDGVLLTALAFHKQLICGLNQVYSV